MQKLAPKLAQQQRALEWAIAQVTAPLPGTEQQLLAFAQQLPVPPEPVQKAEVYHLFYCSQAARTFAEEQLVDLLEASLAWNARCGITEILCNGNEHFVQVLAGEATAVESLFARIQRGRWHHHMHMHVLSRGTGLARQFDSWRMAFIKAQLHEFYWLITFLQVHRLLRQIPVAEP